MRNDHARQTPLHAGPSALCVGFPRRGLSGAAMSNVVNLGSFKEEKSPHWSGWARCLHCKHEWVAVAPMGTIDDLECPSCELPRGTIKYNFGAPDGSLVFRCNCGCDVLTCYVFKGKKIIRCLACGEDQTNAVWSPA